MTPVTKLNWSAFTSTGLDLSAAKTALNGTSLGNLTALIDLRASGTVALDILGYALAVGKFEFDQRSGINGSDGAITLTNASAQRLSLSDLQFFVGLGATFVEDANHKVTGISTDDTLGFSVAGASLDLVIVKEGAGTRKWMGLAASVGAMEVHGLSSTFDLQVLDLALRFNGKAADASKLDWSALAGLSGDPLGILATDLSGIVRATDVSITGSVWVNIDNFVYLSGSIALQRKEMFVKTVGATSTTKMSVLTLGASNLRVFAGVGDADSDDDRVVDNDTLLAQNAVGVLLAIDNLAIVLAKPVVALGAPVSSKSYFALSGSGSGSLIGVDGVELSGRVAVSINQGKEKLNNVTSNVAAIDFAASATANPEAFGDPSGLKAVTGPSADQFVIVDFSESNLLKVSGYVSISIADFLHLSGQFAFSQSGTPQTVKIAGSTATKQVNVMTIGASDVNAFVGVGGLFRRPRSTSC